MTVTCAQPRFRSIPFLSIDPWTSHMTNVRFGSCRRNSLLLCSSRSGIGSIRRFERSKVARNVTADHLGLAGEGLMGSTRTRPMGPSLLR